MLNNERQFWIDVSQSTLDAIWNNMEDDVYEQLTWNAKDMCHDVGSKS